MSEVNLRALISTLVFVIAGSAAMLLSRFSALKYPSYAVYVTATAFASWGMFKAAREGVTKFQQRAFHVGGWCYLVWAVFSAIGVSYLYFRGL